MTDTIITHRRHTQWTASEIQQFFKRARRAYQSPELDVRLAPQQYQPWGHLLIVVPRKVGNAPQRNLFKRRVKALYHELQLERSGYDIAIFAKPGASKLSFADLKTLLLRICMKAVQ
jgi:ribonuclease P protein component